MSKAKSTCPCCLRTRVGPIKLWRRNTMYNDDELNYNQVCIHCIREDDLHMYYDWQEYYSSQGFGYKGDYHERQSTDYVRSKQ